MANPLKVAAGIAIRGVSDAALAKAVQGKIILVTGASEGIGAATARRLGRAGATVLLAARTRDRLDEVAMEIRRTGGTAHVYAVDLSRPEQAERLGMDILREHRRVDVVVSNAGRSIRRSVADTADRFHDVVRTADLNYLGPVQLLLTLLPAMRTAGAGHIVNVSTAGVFTPAPNWSAYLASKTAFDVWLRCAVPELRRDGVTVSTFYSGLVRTRMSAPTAYLGRMPAMSAEEAAGAVCRAIARRPRTLQAWWTRPGEVIAHAFKGTVERLLSWQPARPPTGPVRLARLLLASRRYGWTLAAALASGRDREVALIDRFGTLTRGELRAAARDCAGGLVETFGIQERDRVGIRCGSHRGLVVAAAAAGLLGADAVLLPRGSAALRHASGGTGAADSMSSPDHHTDVPVVADDQTWSTLHGPAPERPRVPGRLTVLTSGTTRTPRGVRADVSWSSVIGPALAHLRHIPIRRGRPILVATPAYHGYGLTYLAAGLALGAPVILAPGNDLAGALALAVEHEPTAFFALPEQLAVLAALPGADRLPARTRIVTGAEPLTAELSARLLEVFGDRVFNLFGSTEAGWAAMATPADLRAAPGTVGRAPRGIRLAVLDQRGDRLPPGEVGAVHVGGWQPGGALVPTGDLGHFDRAGRLMLDGRA
ncbi:SDR family NAD(P)-dependent oxidoreductase [Hamadaea tsunoensis]|uniref:SDR family NAD(P)-dependent oxidoreductase n=1 Tax=Hamadaea tsunoensis TaxID=53368 RepID=UPI00040BBD49|nr:SDR family NAD(P)-dependent oxidoreductase [Hamadaea tsunoensis]